MTPEPIFPLQTEVQKIFLGQNRGDVPDEPERLRLSDAGEGDLSAPQCVTLNWDPAEGSVILLAEDPDFTDAVRIEGDGRASVRNLKAGCRYFWKPEEPERGETRTFLTEDCAPRFLGAEGVCNIRDTGGRKTADGRRIRQGLIYRGCEFNGHCTVTPAGINALVGAAWGVGVRTDLDLRGEAVGVIDRSPLGEDVNWILIPVKAYEHLWEDDEAGKQAVRRIFAVFADERRYPIYYHCWGGADRTGSIAWLLGAILGMTEEDLILDYELTSLARIFGPRSRFSPEFTAFMAALDAEEGKTAREKAESFLHSCGIGDDTLSRIRENLLEPLHG